MWRLCFVYFLASLVSSQSPLSQLSQALESSDAQRVSELTAALLRSPDANLDTLLQAGVLLAQHDLLSEAIRVFEYSARKYPASFEAAYNLALTRFAAKDFAQALAALTGSRASSAREEAASRYLSGKIYAATGQTAQARQNLEAAYHARPAEENYALDLALFYVRSGADVPAINVLRPSLKLHPESQPSQLVLALADSLAGRRADAVALCEDLVRRDSTATLPRLIAAFSECMDNNFGACERQSAAGLASPHPDPYLYYLHASALFNSGNTDYPKMNQDLGIAVERMPDCSVCFLLRSRVYEKAGNTSAALADLNKVVQLDPKLAPAWYRLATLYRRTGQQQQAAEALEHYRSLHDNQAQTEMDTFRSQVIGALDASPQ